MLSGVPMWLIASLLIAASVGPLLVRIGIEAWRAWRRPSEPTFIRLRDGSVFVLQPVMNVAEMDQEADRIVDERLGWAVSNGYLAPYRRGDDGARVENYVREHLRFQVANEVLTAYEASIHEES
jgi:hypothetical protein